MMNETNILSEEKIIEPAKLPVSQTSTAKEVSAPAPTVAKKLPAPAKETPVNKWIMPPEQHGYIQANDKDCL
jgi:hypothetical protein